MWHTLTFRDGKGVGAGGPTVSAPPREQGAPPLSLSCLGEGPGRGVSRSRPLCLRDVTRTMLREKLQEPHSPLGTWQGHCAGPREAQPRGGRGRHHPTRCRLGDSSWGSGPGRRWPCPVSSSARTRRTLWPGIFHRSHPAVVILVN